jgi:hypothetical protein
MNSLNYIDFKYKGTEPYHSDLTIFSKTCEAAALKKQATLVDSYFT